MTIEDFNKKTKLLLATILQDLLIKNTENYLKFPISKLLERKQLPHAVYCPYYIYKLLN